MNLPTLQIIRYKLADLIPDLKNPNHMEADRYALLVSSIRKLGFLQPIVVEPVGDGSGRAYIRDGHHRTRAIGELGYDEIDTIHGTKDSAPHIGKAIQLAMNRLRGELNLSQVAVELEALSRAGWSTEELTITGFNPTEVNDLLDSQRIPDDAIDGAASVMEPPEPSPSEEAKTFLLEIAFPDRKAMSRAKRVLRKASGGGSLTDGLIHLIAEYEGR